MKINFKVTSSSTVQALQGELDDALCFSLSPSLLSYIGVDGRDGVDGINGRSAYESALAYGFVGSEQDWVDSLKTELGGHIYYNPAGLTREVPRSGDSVQRHLEQVHKNLDALKEFEILHIEEGSRNTNARIGGITLDHRDLGGALEITRVGGLIHEITHQNGGRREKLGNLVVDMAANSIGDLKLEMRHDGGARFLNDKGEYHPVVRYDDFNGSMSPMWHFPSMPRQWGSGVEPASPYRVLDYYIDQLMPREEKRQLIQLMPRFEHNYDVATVNLFNPDPFVQKYVTVAIGMRSDYYDIEVIVTNHSETEQVHGVHIRGVAIGF